MGRYSRVDGKRSSSSFGLTITIVLIVSLSLVGAWMFMSSWSAPTESIDFSSSQTTTKDVETTSKSDFTNEKNEETEVVTESNQEKVEERKEFEDKNGEGDRKEGEGEKDTESESEKEKTQVEENTNESEDNTEKKSEENAEKNKDVFPAGDQAEITKESTTRTGSWSTQLVESQNEKKAQVSSSSSSIKWKLCNVTAGPDYIPCLDNLQAIRKLHSTKHYEHRERHCPEEAPRCLVPLPEGYKRSIKWPKSREKVF